MRSFIRSTLILLPATVLVLAVSIAQGQTTSEQKQVATVVTPPASTAKAANLPAFTDYRGAKIGMTAEEVRAKLDGLKKGDGQDFLVFGEHESAQISTVPTFVSSLPVDH